MHRRIPVFLAAAALAAAAFPGCGGPPAAPVEPTLARDTLVRVLNGWKDGAKPGDFREQSPSVVVQDVDWLNGAALLSYELLGDGEAQDANLNCPVRLVTREPSGKESTKDVTYIVGTDPVLTVFRKIF